MTIWVLNVFLYLAYVFNAPLYQALVQAGDTQMYTCMELTASGFVPSNACATPPPAFPGN